MHIRRGRLKDLPSLTLLEDASFEPERRESEAVLRYSLHSRHQEVWIATEGGRNTGSLFMRFHKRTAKIHSIAIDPALRGRGIGRRLLEYAAGRAEHRGCSILSLEADARNRKLLDWYTSEGFVQKEILSDYYAPGWPAWRLSRRLKTARESSPQKT